MERGGEQRGTVEKFLMEGMKWKIAAGAVLFLAGLPNLAIIELAGSGAAYAGGKYLENKRHHTQAH